MAVGVATLLYVYQLVVGVILVADCLFGCVFSGGEVVLLADVAGSIVLILYAIAIGLFLFYQLVGLVVAVFNIVAQCFGFFDQVVVLIIGEVILVAIGVGKAGEVAEQVVLVLGFSR
ncbi:hypothetical protein SALWKB12_2089 [Snodgrassella communis]|nr:hypothetical protein SALWKB12_2278 [Snodgrassella communis]KDN11593.1 hypothetical protein SALWKB12_2089 [Snodgrassella communis]